jgi:hypothetical protein
MGAAFRKLILKTVRNSGTVSDTWLLSQLMIAKTATQLAGFMARIQTYCELLHELVLCSGGYQYVIMPVAKRLSRQDS